MRIIAEFSFHEDDIALLDGIQIDIKMIKARKSAFQNRRRDFTLSLVTDFDIGKFPSPDG